MTKSKIFVYSFYALLAPLVIAMPTKLNFTLYMSALLVSVANMNFKD